MQMHHHSSPILYASPDSILQSHNQATLSLSYASPDSILQSHNQATLPLPLHLLTSHRHLKIYIHITIRTLALSLNHRLTSHLLFH